MAFVLTRASTIACKHDGAVEAEGNQLLTIDSEPVLTAIEIIPGTTPMDGCKTTKNVELGNLTCSKIGIIATPGTSTTLMVAGNPVMLDTLKGTTTGTLGGLLQPFTASAKQSMLEAE